MNVLRRKGYVAKITFDGREKIFTGRVLGIDDVVGFHGDSVHLLTKAFAIAVNDYQASCRALGHKVQLSHSGTFSLRVEPRTHAKAAMAAEARGLSLNKWIEQAIRRTARVDLGEVNGILSRETGPQNS